ncbi:MAG TPA: condensation domain-containing protein, partial [Pyrinomonadaceae bacterium]|nr:condensation domain-containing protein [Pyrinomonadaceae bacterium]
GQVKVRGFRIELGEIEAVLAAHEHVREVVALAREDHTGAKRVVAYFVAEAGRRPTVGALRAYLQERLPLYMIPSAFVAMDAFPLTPNGKADRRALPAPGDAGADSERDYAAPRNAAEETLADIWRQVLGVERVGVNDNFFELGGDSILSLQIISRANQSGIRLDPQQLFQFQTVAQLAEVAGKSPALKAEQVVAAGDFPLTPIQRWFFEGDDTDRGHFNQSLMLELRGALAADVLRRAVEHLPARHDALRMRFSRESGVWRQSYAESETHSVFSEIDLSALPQAARAAAVEDACESAQRGLDLEEGPLMRAVLFRLGASGPDRLLLSIHHLVVDGVSWRILVEDLQKCCAQLLRGEEINLGPKTSSFRQWAEGLKRYAGSAGFEDEAGYWGDARRLHAPRIKTDGSGVNTVASARTVRVELADDETRALLQELPQNSNTQIQEVLLTALVLAFGRRDGLRVLLLDVEGHGRAGDIADVDLSRTVGWFTAVYPVLLESGADATPGQALGLVKEQLRRVPRGGLGYGLLRYLRGEDDARRLAALPAAEVSFNYLGQVDQVLRDSELFALTEKGAWLSRSPRAPRRHLIEIDGSVVAGRLTLGWAYSENVHRRQTVERLAGEFVAALRELISHCRQTQAGGFTPSDFPLARLNQAKLDKLASLLNK